MTNGDFITRLDALFASWNRSDQPGLSVGVVHNGTLIFRRGFGAASLEAGTRITPATRMRIGSITKHFTAVLALRLAEAGCIDLDAPIRTILSELQGPSGAPSIRQLLRHRGGIRCHLDIGVIAHGLVPSPQGYGLTLLSRTDQRNFERDTAMLYCNGGYHLVSLALERAGHDTLENLFRVWLFDPLGMHATALVPSDYTITPDIASLHIPGKDGLWRRGLFPSEELLGEGGLVSNIDDLLLWAAHLRNWSAFGSRADWDALTSCPPLQDGEDCGYGLGLMVGNYRGRQVVQHSGVMLGGTAQFMTFPEDGLDIVILINGAPAAHPVRLSERIADLFFEGQLAAPLSPARASDHAAWVGHWWSEAEGMLYSLSDSGGDLKLTMAGQVGMPLYSESYDTLISPVVSTGKVSLSLTGPDECQTLSVHFGGRTVPFVRLTEGRPDVEALFAEAAFGSYYSEEAAARATISRDDTGLNVHIHDDLGGTRYDLTPLGETVAGMTQPFMPFPMAWWVLSLAQNCDGNIAGFRISTARTRNLVFTRMPHSLPRNPE
ncbi:serine hydrolase domain-containing protein [Gluconobacter cerinus]|uniref:serine hydrolase domain-containing protein n=1 Tax=Gluconobacter cerinus TaxID=38307 RepID=UPI001B8D936D|nr:serine hydrolase domain-containing protein [Gluconobacter cerinus]MBS0995528.1 beta-lactamase family protein [Gluconobacter cerinus]